MLSNSGAGTRSTVSKLIRSGKVTVNGSVVKDPGVHVSESDEVVIGGAKAEHKEYLYYMLDKPDCVLTAMEDKRLPTVAQFIPPEVINLKLSPVGRLDYHTTGLLIITNDGNLSHRLTSPKYSIPKVYQITYEGNPLTNKHVEDAAQGVVLTDKDTPIKLAPAELKLVSDNQAELTLYEGKTHEVRRIIASWGRSVVELRRVSVGCLSLDNNSTPGTIKEIPGDTVKTLKESVGL